jgi:tRNA nucleotidyltransferase (CCA-adding enzyme)
VGQEAQKELEEDISVYEKVKAIVDPVYMVGGCVRDELLGTIPDDYDFATPLLPDEIEQKIRQAGKRAYNVGKRYGTVGVKIDGQLVEITTFRNEHYTPGSRKPQVGFVKDITADLSRRDFTINAMAKRDGKLIDPFGGQEDLKNRVVRCVGNARERFKEDPLRMLRVARFMSKLDFAVDADTLDKTEEMSYKILEVSRERWTMEMDKLLVTRNPVIGLRFMMDTKLFNFMIPEISLQNGYDQNSPYHAMPLWEHTMVVVDNVAADVELRWAALLHDIAKPFVRHDRPDRSNYIKHDMLGAEMVERIALHLKWSNSRRENVKNLVATHLKDDNPLRKADFIGKDRPE